jgi:hypothetical protein
MSPKNWGAILFQGSDGGMAAPWGVPLPIAFLFGFQPLTLPGLSQTPPKPSQPSQHPSSPIPKPLEKTPSKHLMTGCRFAPNPSPRAPRPQAHRPCRVDPPPGATPPAHAPRRPAWPCSLCNGFAAGAPLDLRPHYSQPRPSWRPRPGYVLWEAEARNDAVQRVGFVQEDHRPAVLAAGVQQGHGMGFATGSRGSRKPPGRPSI